MSTRTEILIRDHKATGKLPEDLDARQQLLKTYQRQNKLSSLEVCIGHARSSRAGEIADRCIEDIKALFEPWMGKEKRWGIDCVDHVKATMEDYFRDIQDSKDTLGFTFNAMHPVACAGPKPSWWPVSGAYKCLWQGMLVYQLYGDYMNTDWVSVQVVFS